MTSSLRAQYDGFRREKHMVVLLPMSEWGGKAYGIPKESGSTLSVRQPEIGEQIRVTVTDNFYAHLVRQRERRKAGRLRKKLL